MSNVGLHDHTKKPEGGIFCPLMKEMCHNGWTESMGLADEKLKTKPSCVRWVGVFVKRGVDAPMEEVFDCADRWHVDMLQQVAQEVYQGAAATEQVRNHVAGQTQASQVMIAFFQGIAKRMRAPIVLPDFTKKPPALANGKGGGHEH